MIQRLRQVVNRFPVPEELRVCLPHDVEAIPFQVHQQANSVAFVAKSANLRLFGAGLFGSNPLNQSVAGILFGASSPLIQVARFDGRCYLRNGFHRSFGLRKAGATHVPCLLLESNDYAQIGARGGGATFERTILESDNPPTCGHLAQDRAHPVRLKRVTKMIQVTWSDYSILDAD